MRSPEPEPCASLARGRMGVACQGRVPGRQLLSQVGRGAGKRERKTLDGRFEVNFKAGSGFNPSAQRCPDMGLPVFLCWK